LGELMSIKDPPLTDEDWGAFLLEKEENSELAVENWSGFRIGLRRLERKFLRRVPVNAMRRALAEDAFFCATHWKLGPRVVRPALAALLKQAIDTRIFAFAAAEFWLWALRVSPADSFDAEGMVRRARKDIETKPLEELTRRNLRRMMSVVVDRNRAPGCSDAG
jgi:hypothetical protein